MCPLTIMVKTSGFFLFTRICKENTYLGEKELKILKTLL
jgi:hypothetical protein